MPAAPPVRAALRSATGVAQREGLEHAERRGRPGPVAVPVADLADRLVQRLRQRDPRRLWSGRASSLPVPQRPAYGLAAQRVEQHGLADAAQPGEHHAALGTARGDPLEDDVELLRAARRGRPARAGAGRRRGRTGSGSGPRQDRIGLSSGFRRCGAGASATVAVRPDVSASSSASSAAGVVVGLVEARAQHGDQVGHLVDGEPERAGADVVAPQRQHDQLPTPGATRPAARGRSPRASRKIDPGAAAGVRLGHAPIVLLTRSPVTGSA